MHDLTDKGILIYCTLKELMIEDIDFLRALITCIEADIAKCERNDVIPPILFIEDWIAEDCYFFSDDEKDIFKQLLKQFGVLPMFDAVFKLHNEYQVEKLMYEMGITTVKVEELDRLKEKE